MGIQHDLAMNLPCVGRVWPGLNLTLQGLAVNLPVGGGGAVLRATATPVANSPTHGESCGPDTMASWTQFGLWMGYLCFKALCLIVVCEGSRGGMPGSLLPVQFIFSAASEEASPWS